MTTSKWDERGQSLVELALVLPMLLLLAMGTIDLGMGFKTYIGLSNAAREAVRWVTTYPSDVSGALARAQDEAGQVGLAAGEISSGGYTIDIAPAKASYTAGDEVVVTIRYDYQLMFGMISGLPEVPFQSSATMVVLYDN